MYRSSEKLIIVGEFAFFKANIWRRCTLEDEPQTQGHNPLGTFSVQRIDSAQDPSCPVVQFKLFQWD